MEIADINSFKQKALKWASNFDVCCCLDSNQYNDPYSQYDCLIAAGQTQHLTANAGNAFEQLQHFYDKNQDWMFGLLSYELKNEIESLSTKHTDKLHFPDLYFFVPKYLIALSRTEIKIIKGGQHVIDEINKIGSAEKEVKPALHIESRYNRDSYIETVHNLQNHIKRGDIYEINFCQEFFAKNAVVNPVRVYQDLNAISPTPFAGFLKLADKYILSATPERFLCKRGRQLISQPIKGTAKRSSNPVEDEQIKITLKSSIKEQAENVMIVDLVRNDLTKSAVKGSVKVDELFGIYTFPQVHQMISTISCELAPDMPLLSAIKNTFPMGSMTGAPKN
jgi:para-aminobenzoate synthetase component 1